MRHGMAQEEDHAVAGPYIGCGTEGYSMGK